MEDCKKAGILLVLYNEERYIEKLVNSILNQSYKNISVYALDNNSSDSSAGLLGKLLPDAYLHLSEENLGFAKANNLLAEKAIKNKEDYLFILNTDMELDIDCVMNLVEIISADENLAGAGPIIFYGTDNVRTSDVQSYADITNFSNARTRTLYSGTGLDFDQLPEKVDVNTLHGGGFMIRSKIVSEIGLFNEDNFMYNDEIDLAYRIHRLNKKLLVTKKAKAWHYHDWSKRNRAGYFLQYYYINRNRILFFYRYKKYFSIINQIISEILLLPVRISWAIRTVSIKLLKYYYLGYIHGLLNRKGKAKIEFK